MLALVCLLVAPFFARAATTTFDETDSRITYSGSWTQAFPCTLTENGTFVGSQGGCYNIQPNCTTSFKVSHTIGDSATIKFKGTSVTVGLLSSDIASVISVDLDGASIPDTLDMHGDSKAFTCAPLVKKDGLDGKKEHTLVLKLTGASKQDALGATQIMIDSVTITTSDDSDTSSTDTSSASTPSTTQDGSALSTRASHWIALGTAFAMIMTLF
ncbi:hypothetical protein EXIGLDRAFT_64824 [Exidia glandulosa HHB12029]|uniref:Uncharacterized protein n=1 Tax=Exidia glandulosa HHB12029 TaxID=1314781 RepID=A0A165P1W1_EXIGL|nr:hypothetical protein EXIGLDRAFT_64824 [Exidia glandulosa HHB12029]